MSTASRVTTPSRPLARTTEALALLAILLVAAWFRRFLQNSGVEGRVFWRHDEMHYVGHVVRFLRGDWEVRYFTNPSVSIYLMTAATWVWGWIGVLTGHHESFAAFREAASSNTHTVTLVGRTVAASFGVASVALLHLIARSLVGVRGGLIAAFALAVSFVHAEQGLLAGSISVVVFFVLGFFHAALRYLDRPTLVRHLTAGVWLGLAASTKYNAGIMVLVFIGATLVAARARVRDDGGRVGRALLAPPGWSGFAAAVVAFFVGSPWALLHPSRLFATLRTLSDFRTEGWTPAEGEEGPAWRYFVESFGSENTGVPFAVACGLGLVLASWQVLRGRDVRMALVLLAIVPLYLVLGSGVNYSGMRYLLPAIPLIYVLGARALVAVLDGATGWLSHSRFLWRTLVARSGSASPAWLALLAPVVGIAMMVPFSLKTDARLAHDYGGTDMRRDLFRWVHDQVGAGDRLWELTSSRAQYSPFYTPLRSGRKGRDPVARDLVQAIAESPTFPAFIERLKVEGRTRLVVVLPVHMSMRIDNLPNEVRDPALRQCAYWSGVVAWLRSLTPKAYYVTPDGRVGAALFDLGG